MDTFDKTYYGMYFDDRNLSNGAYDDSCNETQTNWNEPIIDELLEISVID